MYNGWLPIFPTCMSTIIEWSVLSVCAGLHEAALENLLFVFMPDVNNVLWLLKTNIDVRMSNFSNMGISDTR